MPETLTKIVEKEQLCFLSKTAILTAETVLKQDSTTITIESGSKLAK